MSRPTGEMHPRWAGLQPRSGAMHLRIVRARGKASEYLCDSCEEGSNGERWTMDWAHIHDTDPNDVNNYMPMCRKCHMLYDKSSLVAAQVLEIRELLSKGVAQHKIAKEYGVSQMTISRINTRKTWRHI